MKPSITSLPEAQYASQSLHNPAYTYDAQHSKG
jgi:hypothetical protein